MYGMVIVSRNLERTNENDGFKMTALEITLHQVDVDISYYIDCPKKVCTHHQIKMYVLYCLK